MIEGVLGLSYDHPGRSTEEYVQVLTGLLRGDSAVFDGKDWSVHATGWTPPLAHPVPVLVAAPGPRLLRVAGAIADGTLLWMAPTRAIEEHIAPKVNAAAAEAGRPAPRIVAGLPVVVHDDEAEARTAVTKTSAIYAGMANCQRILDIGGAADSAAEAIVGDETAVRAQIQGLLDAGATDIWAAVVAAGSDRAQSFRRTTDLLKELVA